MIALISSLRKRTSGFTLIELMLVMVILGILITMVSGNLLTSLKRGRDSRRKQDLSQVAKALELYYADFGKYPAATGGVINGCGTGGASSCSWGNIFSASNATGTTTVTYMVQLPADPSTGRSYFYDSNGQDYQLYALLENADDPDIPASGPYYDTTDCGGGNHCNYGISSVNSAVTDNGNALTSTP